MEEKRLVPVEVSAILLILCICGLLLNVYQFTIFYNVPLFLTMNIVACVSYVLASMYCIKGYKKSYASLYKYTFVSLVVSAALYLYSLISSDSTETITTILTVLAMMILLSRAVLAFTKDLGKMLSTLFVVLLLLCSITTMIVFLKIYLIIGLDCIGMVCLDVILAIMVYGKYKDKETRGSK